MHSKVDSTTVPHTFEIPSLSPRKKTIEIRSSNLSLNKIEKKIQIERYKAWDSKLKTSFDLSGCDELLAE